MALREEGPRTAERPPAELGPQAERPSMMTHQPVTPPLQRLDTATTQARSSVDDVIRWVSRQNMGGLLGGAEGQQALAAISRQIAAERHGGERAAREFEYGARAFGHPGAPTFFYSNADARAHCQGIMEQHFRELASLPPPPGQISMPPPPIDGAMERSATAPAYAQNESIGADLARRMLDYGFFGPWLQDRFTLPQIVTPPQEFFDLFRQTAGGNPWGLYYPGTNMIIISPQAADLPSRREVMLHEMLHYSAYLGGGGQTLRWRDDSNQPVTRTSVWLDEGLTQFHTKEILARAGLNSGGVTYAAETLVAFHLQNIAGPETLRRAYLTGDFTEVREEVDRQLGQHAFDTLMRQDSGAEALATLRTMMGSAGINYAALETGQIAGPAADVLRRQGIA